MAARTATSPEVQQAPPQVVEILEELDPSQQAVIRQYMEMAYSGPLPPAHELTAYDRVIPNGADRIMKMAEEEQAHRHRQDDKRDARLDRLVDTDILLSKRGQLFGGWATLALILAALGFAYLDKLPVALATFLGGALVQLSAWVMNRSASYNKAPTPLPGNENKGKATP